MRFFGSERKRAQDELNSLGANCGQRAGYFNAIDSGIDAFTAAATMDGAGDGATVNARITCQKGPRKGGRNCDLGSDGLQRLEKGLADVDVVLDLASDIVIARPDFAYLVQGLLQEGNSAEFTMSALRELQSQIEGPQKKGRKKK
jgi:hypothetical protein